MVGHIEHIERCGNRVVITAGGVSIAGCPRACPTLTCKMEGWSEIHACMAQRP
jgi:hypothetical protein